MAMNGRFILLVLSLLLIHAGLAWAKGPPGVQYTVHNMSASSPEPVYTHSNEEQVCIFCHTPHGASSTAALWNRSNPSTTYTHYTSTRVGTAVSNPNRATSNESLVCLSCHDGSIAVNQILNISNLTGGPPINDFTGGDVFIDVLFESAPAIIGAKIGASILADGSANNVSTDLFDDHPISFSYDVSYAAFPTELQDVATAVNGGNGVRFFGASNRVECSTCHDPHVNYWDLANGGDADYTPFLIMPNVGSALCFSCHIK